MREDDVGLSCDKANSRMCLHWSAYRSPLVAPSVQHWDITRNVEMHVHGCPTAAVQSESGNAEVACLHASASMYGQLYVSSSILILLESSHGTVDRFIEAPRQGLGATSTLMDTANCCTCTLTWCCAMLRQLTAWLREFWNLRSHIHRLRR